MTANVWLVAANVLFGHVHVYVFDVLAVCASSILFLHTCMHIDSTCMHIDSTCTYMNKHAYTCSSMHDSTQHMHMTYVCTCTHMHTHNYAITE